MTRKIQLIVGSTRQNRAADAILTWLVPQIEATADIELEVVDLKTEDLPFFNAPVSPMYAPDESEAGKRWAARVAPADGYIFLTPEYNRSVPAALKNALDFLLAEWKEKPAVVVSYGWIDGGQSAARHLTDILDWLKIATVQPQVHLKFEAEMMNEQGQLANAVEAFTPQNEQLAQALKQLANA